MDKAEITALVERAKDGDGAALEVLELAGAGYKEVLTRKAVRAGLMLDVSQAPRAVKRPPEPQVGDIYRKAGGPNPGQGPGYGYWWVIAVQPAGSCHVLSIDSDGNIYGAQRYGYHYFANNTARRVGFCELPEFLNVVWESD